MPNAILESWYERELCAAKDLADQSDLLDLALCPDQSQRALLVRYTCKGLVRDLDGRISNAEESVVGIRIPDHYLRQANTFEILAWLSPLEIWHPNIRPPYLCIGHLSPGMSLVDILYQIFEIITYHKVSPGDYLNDEAAAWARTPDARRLFPVDPRPLKRPRLPTSKPMAGECEDSLTEVCDR